MRLEAAMNDREILAQVQAELKCEHVGLLGEACDYGGWAVCTCDILARKRAESALGQTPQPEK